jgi:hypothetical protein
MAAKMIPVNCISVKLTPNVSCVIEETGDGETRAIIKRKTKTGITLSPEVWNGLLRKKQTLSDINECLLRDAACVNSTDVKISYV